MTHTEGIFLGGIRVYPLNTLDKQSGLRIMSPRLPSPRTSLLQPEALRKRESPCEYLEGFVPSFHMYLCHGSFLELNRAD